MKRILSIILALTMILSTVAFAVPTMVSTVETTAEIAEDSPAVEEQTAEVAAEYPGTLIAKVDFENASEGDVIIKEVYTLAETIGTVNTPEGFPKLYLNTTGGTLNVKKNEDGTMYATWDFEGAGPGWAKIGFYTKQSESKLMPEGQYTLVMNCKWITCKVEQSTTDEETGDVTTTLVDKAVPSFSATFTPNLPNGTWYNGENNYCPSVKKANNADTGYTTLSTTASLYKGQTISTNENKNFTFLGFGKAAFYLDANTTYWNKASIAVDDICLYYKAPDVTVTLDDENPSTTNEVFELVSNNQSLDLAPYALASDSTRAFTGWKVAGTNDSITKFAPTAAGNYTLVPVYNYYAPGLGFEGDEYTNAADLAKYIWNHSGDKPSGSSFTFTDSINQETGTYSIGVKYNDPSNITFPVNTSFSTYLNKQINSTLPLNTNRIKGLEFKYRVIAPEGAENASKYFTSANALKTKLYYKVNWPEGVEETECYGGEGINGWHWGECIGYSLDTVAAKADYNGDWLTAQFNLDGRTSNHHGDSSFQGWKDADQCTNFRILFVSDTQIMGDFTVEIDYIRFILADGLVNVTPEYVSSNFYDLRKGYFDVTFAEKLDGINDDEVYNIVSGADIVASELISTEGGATYRFYAATSLANKTVSFQDYAYTSTGVITASPALKAVTHTYTLAEAANKHDGENLFPNGDFSNPYYNVFTTSGAAHNTHKIVDGKLEVTLTKEATEWNTLTASGVFKLIPETHYYVSYNATFTKDADGNPHKGSTVLETSTAYFPVLDGTMSLAKNEPDSASRIATYSYIPSTTSGGSYIMIGESTLGKPQNVTRVIDVKSADYYADTSNIKFSTATNGWDSWKGSFFDKASIYLQPCFSEGLKNSLFAKNDKLIPSLEGLQYVVDGIVVKEMFPVIFKDGETVLDTYYAARDVPFILPSALGEKEVAAWVNDEGGYFVAGTEYTPDVFVAEGISFSPVYADAPYNRNKTSIRFTEPGGIRFLASVTDSQRKAFDEYGFIVTRNTILDSLGLENDALTFDLDKGKYVFGQSYLKDGDKLPIDKIYELSEDNLTTFFTAVVTGIPEQYYADKLVVRPYAKMGDVYSYGEITQSSILDTAKKIRDGGFKGMTQQEIDKVQDILEICGVPNEKDAIITANGDNGQIYCAVDENGNATSGNANITIVDDPVNSGRGNVYLVQSNLTKDSSSPKAWTYIQFTNCGLEAGQKYHISYDVLAYPYDCLGNSISDATIFSENVGALKVHSNIFFNSNNHTDGDGTKYVNVTPSKWGTVDYYYTMPEDFKSETTYYVGAYTDPILPANGTVEVARSFYIDNVRVVKVVE